MHDYLYNLALRRHQEQGHITEFHWDTDGDLHVTVPEGSTLHIPSGAVGYFVSGIYIGEG